MNYLGQSDKSCFSLRVGISCKHDHPRNTSKPVSYISDPEKRITFDQTNNWTILLKIGEVFQESEVIHIFPLNLYGKMCKTRFCDLLVAIMTFENNNGDFPKCFH